MARIFGGCFFHQPISSFAVQMDLSGIKSMQKRTENGGGSGLEGHISIQGGQTAGRYHIEMVLIKNDMTCP